MAISLVQTTSQGASGSGTTLLGTFSSNVTAGNMLVLFASNRVTTSPISSISDSGGDTFTNLIIGTHTTTVQGELWYSPNINGGTCVVTVNWSGGAGSSQSFLVREYTGLTSTPLDQLGSLDNSATTALISGTTATTTQGSELVVASLAAPSGGTPVTANSPFGNLGTVTSTAAGAKSLTGAMDNIVSSTGKEVGTFTITSQPGFGFIATFKATSSGAAVVNQTYKTLLGVGNI